MRSYFIHQQSLFRLQLNKKYFYELVGVKFLNLKDLEGNSLTLYESDYLKLKEYLKENEIKNFTDLRVPEKLMHLENAGVRVTKYFSSENIYRYEIDVKTSMENNLEDIVSVDGKKLLKKGAQNCVVVYNNHIYIHPKVRCVLGSLNYEVTGKDDANQDKKPGVIGVSHSSLCQGAQVTFAGSIVYDESGTWSLETTSGHYLTRGYQIKALLLALKHYGMDLTKFNVKLWIPNNPKLIPPILLESDYCIIRENASEYLERMQDVPKRIKLG